MIASILGDVLLRKVPEHLIAGMQSGEVKVYGSVIKSMVSGQIVGHLQETSGLAKLAGMALASPVSAPLAGAGLAADLIGHGINYVQNRQIVAALKVVQSLQVANSALSVIGIGVSVAGFAILAAKINRMETSVNAMAGRLAEIGSGIEWLRHDRIAEDFSRLRTLAEQMEEGWSLVDPGPQWRQVATDAHSLATIFGRRTVELIADPKNLVTAEPFAEALALAVSLRVSARLASGEDVAAAAAADEGARFLVTVGERVSLAASALQQMRANLSVSGSRSWGDILDSEVAALRPHVTAYRQRETVAASTSLTLTELRRQLIPGRTWLEAARSEHNEPVICLLPSTS